MEKIKTEKKTQKTNACHNNTDTANKHRAASKPYHFLTEKQHYWTPHIHYCIQRLASEHYILRLKINGSVHKRVVGKFHLYSIPA